MHEVSAFRCGKKSSLVKRADALLKHLVKDLGIEEGIRLAQIRFDWHTLFQKPLADHMSPFLLSEGELLLTVDSPVWIQELKFYREDILKKLASYQVRTCRFRLGKVNPPADRGAKRRGQKSRSLTDYDRSFIEEAVSDIQDGELKRTIQKTIARAITGGKTA